MVSETITAATPAKAGMLASLIALVSKDMDLMMVIIVGFIGGVLFFFKEWTHLTVKTTKLKALSELMVTIPMSISTAGVVFYLGNDILHRFLEIDSAIWIFLALMASLHYKKLVSFFSSFFSELLTGLKDVIIQFVKNKLGKK